MKKLNKEKWEQSLFKNGNIDIKRTKEQKIRKIFYSLFLQKALLKQSGISTVILYRRAGEAELLLPPRGPSLSWPSSWPCLGKRLYQGMGVSIWACPDMICVGGGGSTPLADLLQLLSCLLLCLLLTTPHPNRHFASMSGQQLPQWLPLSRSGLIIT